MVSKEPIPWVLQHADVTTVLILFGGEKGELHGIETSHECRTNFGKIQDFF